MSDVVVLTEQVEESGEKLEHVFDVARLDEYGPEALITESALARMFHRHPASIKRAVARGELPPSARLLGGPVWTVGAIIRHVEKRLAEALKEQERVNRKAQELRP
jgi:hypothetical protein